MAFRQTPQLGPQLDQVGPFHWDGINITEPSPKLGTREHGTDGHVYLLVKASGTIAALSTGREVIVTEPAMTAATGAGGWLAPPNQALANGDVFWARKSTL